MRHGGLQRRGTCFCPNLQVSAQSIKSNMTVVTVMNLLYYCPLLLVLLMANVSTGARKVNGVRTVNVGCNLQVPDAVKQQMEAMGNKGNPLIISVDIKVLGVRDVADSGGSYGVYLG